MLLTLVHIQSDDAWSLDSQLLETICQASPLEMDDESRTYLISATFAAISGRGEQLLRPRSQAAPSRGIYHFPSLCTILICFSKRYP